MTKQEFLAMSFQKGLKLYVYGQTKFEDYIITIEEMSHNGEIYFGGGWNNIENNSEYFKPICRNLSDLTKEIEHKGERFVPINRIKESQYHLFLRGDITSPLEGLQFSELRKLIEWHFDIADLISKGEAIDVNTLEINPYK